MDLAIVNWFAAHRSAPLDALAVFVAVQWRAGLIFTVAGIVRALLNKKVAMAAWQTVLAVLLASLLANGIIKSVIHRPRPFAASATLQVVGDRPTSESFPSGHAATAVAGALLLASTWPQARAAIWAVAAIVAVSRVYIGVHYPTDVIAGALVGLAAGWFVRGRTVWRWRTGAAATGTPS
jgi:undecaprenyl-diphosphatase